MIEVRRLGTHIGAEITGIDVKILDAETFDTIYKAWLNYHVIAVRDQDLQIEDFLIYSRRFGPLQPHPSKSTRHPDHTEITVLGIDKFGPDGEIDLDVYRRGAESFHTDGSYETVPFKATQLYSLAVPSTGGDTLFVSMYAAYEALPQHLKLRLEGFHGTYVYGGRQKRNSLLDEEDQNAIPGVHPIIRPHPETGRKALYFDQIYNLGIEELDKGRSDALIEELKGYLVQTRSLYRHQWRKGDIVIWDNRCVYHKAAGDYPPEEQRIHWRVSIKE